MTDDNVEVGEFPTAAPDPRRRSGRRVIGATVAGVALVAAGAVTFVAVRDGAGSGGARSPEAAVLDLVSAAQAEDVLGALEAIDPAERDALRTAVESAQTEGQRLDLLGDTFTLAGVPGVDLVVQGLRLETEEITPDVAVVHAPDGEFVASFDKDAFPVGSAIGDIGSGRESERVDLAELDDDLFLATVERDGKWYVSLSYTVGEYARRAVGGDAELGASVAPVGAASPQEAAQAFAERLVAGDWVGLAALGAPEEGDALRRYAPLLRQLTVENLAGLPASTSSLRDVQWEVTEQGDRAVAKPVAYVVEGTVEPLDMAGAGVPPFDPSRPTVLQRFDLGSEGVVVIPAGEPVPDRVDPATELVPFDQAPVDANYGEIDAHGDVTGYWSNGNPAAPGEPIPYRIERRDGCTTMTGDVFDSQRGFGYLVDFLYTKTTPVDGGVRVCDVDRDPIFGVYSLTGLFAPFDVVPQSVALVQRDGLWYVSPLGTIAGALVGGLRAVDTSGFDGALGSYVYGQSRETFEAELRGWTRDQLSPACAAIGEFAEDGTFLRVVDVPDPSAARQCAGRLYKSGPGLGDSPDYSSDTSDDFDSGGWSTYPPGDASGEEGYPTPTAPADSDSGG